MTVTAMTLKPSLSLAEMCDAIGISPRTYYTQVAQGTFPIPEVLPRIGRRPRFSGERVAAYLSGQMAPKRKAS